MSKLIKPHGSEVLLPLYVEDEKKRENLLAEAKSLKSMVLNSSTASNAVMLAAGYFTPLSGYMNKDNVLNVARNMTMSDGLFWAVPIINLTHNVDNLNEGDDIALLDPNIENNPVLAIQQVTAIEKLSDDELNEIALNIYGTNETAHPGVNSFLSSGKYLVSGDIKVLNYSYFPDDFPETFATATEIRHKLTDAGWSKIVAFQTRNPMHRAHEELCKMALDRLDADGVLIHMVLGKLKKGDIPADIRDSAIRKMAELYFPPNSVMISGFGFDMLFAGPREALLHATFRQNCGCTHLIVGRDHAGVGDYYGAFDAQDIFDKPVVKESLKIEIFAADHTAYSKKLNEVVMMRDVKDHNKEDFVLLSGTKVREMLSRGEQLPEEFARKEVAEILIDYYSNL
ncbi:MAG: sulfate adenylyltransferase [Gammaproteobacteria bacterium]|nr:sulfate adenylyltransferase [Gammaproteobacteria bacterium]